MKIKPKQMRDLATFLLGMGGFVHELLFVPVERPFLLTASLALMGFPFVLAGDHKLRGGNGKDSERK